MHNDDVRMTTKRSFSAFDLGNHSTMGIDSYAYNSGCISPHTSGVVLDSAYASGLMPHIQDTAIDVSDSAQASGFVPHKRVFLQSRDDENAGSTLQQEPEVWHGGAHVEMPRIHANHILGGHGPCVSEMPRMIGVSVFCSWHPIVF